LGFFNGKRLDGWTAIFLTTTVLTSLTGFVFPFEGFKPSYVVGGISLLVLAIAIWARYGGRLAGASRWIYVVAAAVALYLNCFVAFLKIPALPALAPTGSEPPFLIAQCLVLAIFSLADVAGGKAVSRLTGSHHLAPGRSPSVIGCTTNAAPRKRSRYASIPLNAPRHPY
jgi:hypothetical protein